MPQNLLRPIIAALAVCSCCLAADTEALRARLAAALEADAVIHPKAKPFAVEKLLPLLTDPVLVREVKAQNARKVPLAEIQAIDKRWIEAEEELPIQREKLSNACADAIRALAKGLPPLREVFVMDDQGANVGQNNLTSDYWQGDEDKWQKSFASGAGGIDVGKAKFDKSANTTLQQVSLPLVDADGSVVGAITFGVAIDAL